MQSFLLCDEIHPEASRSHSSANAYLSDTSEQIIIHKPCSLSQLSTRAIVSLSRSLSIILDEPCCFLLRPIFFPRQKTYRKQYRRRRHRHRHHRHRQQRRATGGGVGPQRRIALLALANLGCWKSALAPGTRCVCDGLCFFARIDRARDRHSENVERETETERQRRAEQLPLI